MIAPAARRMFASLLILGACLALSAAVAAVDVGAAGRWAFDETSGAVAADSVGSLAGAIHGRRTLATASTMVRSASMDPTT